MANRKKIFSIDDNLNVEVFESQRDAARKLDCNVSTISRAIKTNRSYAGRHFYEVGGDDISFEIAKIEYGHILSLVLEAGKRLGELVEKYPELLNVKGE